MRRVKPLRQATHVTNRNKDHQLQIIRRTRAVGVSSHSALGVFCVYVAGFRFCVAMRRVLPVVSYGAGVPIVHPSVALM
jgi:hypothetical protein